MGTVLKPYEKIVAYEILIIKIINVKYHMIAFTGYRIRY